MTYEQELNEIEALLAQLKEIKSCIKKRERLSNKCFEMNPRNSTPKRISKANADLNFHCMDLAKAKTAFARLFKGSLVDVSTGEQEYTPSGFHKYKG